jgi:hypothetical protein
VVFGASIPEVELVELPVVGVVAAILVVVVSRAYPIPKQ